MFSCCSRLGGQLGQTSRLDSEISTGLVKGFDHAAVSNRPVEEAQQQQQSQRRRGHCVRVNILVAFFIGE